MTVSAAAHAELVEAFAWWEARLPDGQTVVADAAINALAAGLEGAALAELAGIPRNENPFAVDGLIDRVAQELDLDPERWAPAELVAVRRRCREVLAGRLSERGLSAWIHRRFHHESEFAALNELALLDDDYEDIEVAGRDTTQVKQQIREAAAALLE